MTSDGSKTYVWDAENRLVEVNQGGNTLATFAYDGQGRRVEKAAGGVTHRYVQDGIHVAEERLSGGVTGAVRYFVGLGIDEWLGRQNADSSMTYLSADHLGSVTSETSATGAATLARSYDVWGNPDDASSGVGGAAYTGRDWEPVAGLYYYRARYYDPRAGRFISPDPLGFVDGMNVYSYVGGNPVAEYDPLGLSGLTPPWTIYWEGIDDSINRPTPGDVSNRYYHCVVHCRLVKESWPVIGRLISYIGDYLHPGGRELDPWDRAANACGREAGEQNEGCEWNCFRRMLRREPPWYAPDCSDGNCAGPKKCPRGRCDDR
jgi:RHS repeat-associated protein